MTSKEALQEMLGLIIDYSYWVKAHEYCEVIKKDLDRLEKLEKENKVLREKVNHFKNVKNRYRRNEKFVEKENEELKKTIETLKEPTCEAKPSYEWVMQQNEKLIEENNKMKIIIDMLLEKEMKHRGDL